VAQSTGQRSEPQQVRPAPSEVIGCAAVVILFIENMMHQKIQKLKKTGKFTEKCVILHRF